MMTASPKPYVITAKYASSCKVCHKQVLPGDRVEWVKGERQVSHVACTESGKIRIAAVEESKAAAPLATCNIEVPVPEGLELLPYQKAGIQYALGRDEGCLFGDVPGLGKTIQAIGYVNASPMVKTVLVVCPASLRVNWEREWKKWSIRTELAVSQYPIVSDVTFINYDILGKLLKTHGDRLWDLVVVDEAHFVKNPKAERTKNLFAIKRGLVLALTGTPLPNKVLEIFPILELVAPEAWDPPGTALRKDESGKKSYVPVGAGEGAGFFKFAKRYCNAHQEWVSKTKQVWVFDGSSNLEELNEKLRSTCMVRRLKEDVLKELPPKRRSVICLPKNGASQMIDEENTVLGEVLKCATLDEALKALANVKMEFSGYSKARHDLAISKIDTVTCHVTDALEGGSEKVVVFAHHHDVIDELNTRLAPYGCVVVTGETPQGCGREQGTRQWAVDTFQNDPKCRVLIGSIGAAGVGLTLTASSHVIFAELPLRPADLVQAEDRTHRIGQKGHVLSEILVFDGSVDAHIARLLVEKQDVADAALDEDTGLSPDLAGRTQGPALDYVEARAKAYSDAGLTPEECACLLKKVQYLAGVCDGAQTEDGSGFNKLDTNIGHSLAACKTLSPKQALIARKLVVKYRRQLEGRF